MTKAATMGRFLSATALLSSAALFLNAADYHGAPYIGGDVFADTWVAVDGAGRTVPEFSQCGPVKRDKWVGIFYWTWHFWRPSGPYDNSKILAQARGAAPK